ncbi:hypothetical protein [Enterocloster asparagiformis]|uniref:hypothetical protein n=1 Tax=Enterocloster asparagiformis TaxID=333367 RepID=UPI000467D0A2|nr:hypothetical protein [Enterocloster asparagiformis]
MKNMRRWITGAALAVSVALVLPFQALAGQENWKHNENGWWYLKDDDTICFDTWLEEDGFWYHFNSSGYMDTGWLEDKGQWYYLGEDGRMYASTTKNIDGAAYMFDDSGASMGNPAQGVYPGEWQGNTFVNTWANYKLTVPEGTRILSGKDLRNYREETFGVEGAAEMDDKCATELFVELPGYSFMVILYQTGNGRELLSESEMARLLTLLYGQSGNQIEGVDQVQLGGSSYYRIQSSILNGSICQATYVRKIGDVFMLVQLAYTTGFADEINGVLNSMAPVR